jgi:hypothetical protein
LAVNKSFLFKGKVNEKDGRLTVILEDAEMIN